MTVGKHYVNNEEFLNALKDRKVQIARAQEAGEEIPPLSNYIGECILKIATHLSYKSNFINYTYREEMVLDGIQTCIQYADNFDPEKSSNPFAYFTQIIYYTFIRRIHKEKKQSYIKGKLLQDVSLEAYDVGDFDDDDKFRNSYIEYLQQNSTFDDSFEKKAASKRKKKKTLEDFMESEDE